MRADQACPPKRISEHTVYLYAKSCEREWLALREPQSPTLDARRRGLYTIITSARTPRKTPQKTCARAREKRKIR